VTRRILASGILLGALGGLAVPAFANEPKREKICIKQQTLLPEGYCITWNDPANQNR